VVNMQEVTMEDATRFLVPVYVAYSVIAVALTVWLARTLFKNGAVYLRDVFPDNSDLAEAVNRLLVVGFYLFNLGYAALLLRSREAATMVVAIETLAFKLGLLLLSLAAMHFVNMFLFHRIRRRSKEALAATTPYRMLAQALPGAGEGHSAFELIERHEKRAPKSKGKGEPWPESSVAGEAPSST
jgi:hypothetical protein